MISLPIPLKNKASRVRNRSHGTSSGDSMKGNKPVTGVQISRVAAIGQRKYFSLPWITVTALVCLFFFIYIFSSNGIKPSQSMENLQHRNSTTTVSDIKIGVNLEDSSNKITEILTNKVCENGGIGIKRKLDRNETYLCICGGHTLNPNNCSLINYDKLNSLPPMMSSNPGIQWASNHVVTERIDKENKNYPAAAGVVWWKLPSPTKFCHTDFDILPKEQKYEINSFYTKILCNYGPWTLSSRKLISLFHNYHTNYLHVDGLLSMNDGRILSSQKYLSFIRGQSKNDSLLKEHNEDFIVGDKKTFQKIMDKRSFSNASGNFSNCLNNQKVLFLYLIKDFKKNEMFLVEQFINLTMSAPEISDCFSFLIHLDGKCSLSDHNDLVLFAKNYVNVKVVPKELNIKGNWGDVTLVYMEVMSWLVALQDDSFKWDFLVNLSENDVPTFPTMFPFLDFLNKFQGSSFTSIDLFPTRINSRFDYSQVTPFEEDRGGAFFLEFPTYSKGSFPETFELDSIYYQNAGSQWHVYNRGLIESMVNTGPAIRYLFHLAFTIIPDEMYFDNLAMSLQFPYFLPKDSSLTSGPLIRSHLRVNTWGGEYEPKEFPFKTEAPVFIARKVYIQKACQYYKKLLQLEFNSGFCEIRKEGIIRDFKTSSLCLSIRTESERDYVVYTDCSKGESIPNLVMYTRNKIVHTEFKGKSACLDIDPNDRIGNLIFFSCRTDNPNQMFNYDEVTQQIKCEYGDNCVEISPESDLLLIRKCNSNIMSQKFLWGQQSAEVMEKEGISEENDTTEELDDSGVNNILILESLLVAKREQLYKAKEKLNETGKELDRYEKENKYDEDYRNSRHYKDLLADEEYYTSEVQKFLIAIIKLEAKVDENNDS